MRLSIDAKSLITIGQDGSIVCFSIDDKELKQKKDREYSEEILIEKSTQDELTQAIKSLKESMDLEKRNHQMLMDKQSAENNAKIELISHEIEEKKQIYDERNRQLQMQKDEIEQEGMRDLDYERKLHKAEMEKKDDEH